MKTKIFIIFFFNTFNYLYSQDTINLPLVEIYGIKPIEVEKINSIDAQNYSAPYSDIGSFLKEIPNLTTIRRGGLGLDPVFRGFRGNQILIQTSEGIQIEGGCPNRMDPTTSHIDLEEVSSISWYNGSDILQFGAAIGGTLILKTIKPIFSDTTIIRTTIKSSYETNVDGFSNSISNSGSFKKFSYRISAGSKIFDNYKNGRGVMVNSSFHKNYYSLKTGYKINNNNSLYLNYTRSESYDVMFPALQMDEKNDFTDILSLNFENNKEQQNNILGNLYFVNVLHNMDNSNRAQYSQIVAPLTGLMQAKTIVKAQTYGFNLKKNIYFKNILFILGTDFVGIYKDGEREKKMIMTMDSLTTTTTKKENVWNQSFVNKYSLFSDLKYFFGKFENKKFHNNLKLSLRYDLVDNYSSDTLKIISDNKNYFSNNRINRHLLSFGVVYEQLYNDFEFKIGLSKTSRNANMNELYIKLLAVSYDSYDYLGNQQLKPETNYQLDFSIKNKNHFGIIGLNLFSSIVNNYIGGILLPPSVIMPSSMGSLGVKQFDNIGKVFFVGGEIVLNSSEFYNFQNISTLSYTYASIFETEKYILTNNQVTDKITINNDPLPEMPAMNFNFQLSYKIKKFNFIPKIEFSYTFPQNFVSNANYESTTPDYSIVNLSVFYKLKYLSITTGIKNLFNNDYYEHLNRRMISVNISERLKLYEPGRSFFIALKIDI